MGECLRRHTFRHEKHEPAEDEWEKVPMDEPSSSSGQRPTGETARTWVAASAAASPSATASSRPQYKSKAMPPTSIPFETGKPLTWNAFQKKWRGYPQREVQIAYAAQYRMVPKLTDDERRQKFAELYPMFPTGPSEAPQPAAPTPADDSSSDGADL